MSQAVRFFALELNVIVSMHHFQRQRGATGRMISVHTSTKRGPEHWCEYYSRAFFETPLSSADAVSFACELSQVMGEGTGKKYRTEKVDSGHKLESRGAP